MSVLVEDLARQSTAAADIEKETALALRELQELERAVGHLRLNVLDTGAAALDTGDKGEGGVREAGLRGGSGDSQPAQVYPLASVLARLVIAVELDVSGSLLHTAYNLGGSKLLGAGHGGNCEGGLGEGVGEGFCWSRCWCTFRSGFYLVRFVAIAVAVKL